MSLSSRMLFWFRRTYAEISKKKRKSSTVPSLATGGGDRTYNNYDYQNFQQVFTGVPVSFKQVCTGVPKIPNKFSETNPLFDIAGSGAALMPSDII